MGEPGQEDNDKQEKSLKKAEKTLNYKRIWWRYMIIMQHLEGAKVVLPAPNTPAQVSCASATTAHGYRDGDHGGKDDSDHDGGNHDR